MYIHSNSRDGKSTALFKCFIILSLSLCSPPLTFFAATSLPSPFLRYRVEATCDFDNDASSDLAVPLERPTVKEMGETRQ